MPARDRERDVARTILGALRGALVEGEYLPMTEQEIRDLLTWRGSFRQEHVEFLLAEVDRLRTLARIARDEMLDHDGRCRKMDAVCRQLSEALEGKDR